MPSPQKPMDAFKKCREQGFSLIEVLVALSIFTVGVLAVALMLDTSIQYNSSARFISEATEIAQFKMEKLMIASNNDAELNAASSPFGPDSFGNYNVSWTVQENIPMSAMKTIKLTVAWSDRGVGKSLTIDAVK